MATVADGRRVRDGHLAADMVYEGARSIHEPVLGLLGASAVVVAAVMGAGEAVALLIRLLSGRLADRSGRYWALTIAGHALTAVWVPLLALTAGSGSGRSGGCGRADHGGTG